MEGRARSGLDFTGLGFELKGVDVKRRIIEGWASTADLDDNDDIVEPGACKFHEAKSVLPFIGHKHDELPVGIPLEVRYDGDRLFTSTRIHNSHAGDDLLTVAAERAEAGMPLGISIGYPHATVKATFERKGGRIIRRIKSLDLVEFSFTPMPTNESAVVTAVKSRWAKMSEDEKLALVLEGKSLFDSETMEFKRDFTQPERDAAEKSGRAMQGGGFPINTAEDLKNAIQAIGRAKDPAAAKAHIKQQAERLGQTDLIPDEWKARADDLETKAGRVLSSANHRQVQTIHDSAHAIADAAGFDLHGDPEDDDSTEGKAFYIDDALRELALAELAT